MSLYDDASFILTPNQYVSGSIYALKPIDGSADMNLFRSSSARRINKNKLIEEVSGDVPRIDYSSGTCPMILVEPQRTNLLKYSNDFTASNWFFSNTIGTITPNDAISPDGTNNATKIHFVDGISDFIQIISIGSDSTFSIYVKGVAGETISFGFGGGSSDTHTFTGDWDRIEKTDSLGIYVWIGTWGATARDMWIYGAQLEDGNYPTSYIETSSATATRVYDNYIALNIQDVIGGMQGTFYFEIDTTNYSVLNDPVLFYFQNSSGDLFYAQMNHTGYVEFVYSINGSTTAYLYWGGVTDGKHKIAIGYEKDNFVLYVDGVQKATDTSSDVVQFRDFGLGYSNPSFISKILYGNIMFFMTRKSNSELQSLTL